MLNPKNLQKPEKALLFLTLLFLPTQLGKHYWPDFSYVYSLKIDYLSPTIYFWDLLVLTLLVVFIAQRKAVSNLALNVFLLFMLLCITSLLPVLNIGTNFGAGLVRLEQYLIAGLFGVYVASIDFKKYLPVFFYSILMALSFESLLGIAQFFLKKTLGFWILGERTFSITTPAIAKFDFQGIEFLRPYATFPHPNVLAAFLFINLALLFLIYSETLVKNVKRLFQPAVAFGVCALLLTVSRTILVASFFSSIFLLPGKLLKWLLLLTVVTSPLLYTRFSSLFSFDSLTILRREDLAGIALNLFSKNPPFGVGLNNFIPAAADQLLVGPSRFLQPVHNIFLLQLSETGLIGLIGLTGLIGVPVWLALKNKSKILFVLWAVIIFLGMFDHYFLTLPQGYRLLFLVWGLSFAVVHKPLAS